MKFARTHLERYIAWLTVVLPSIAALVALAGAATGLARPSGFVLALTALLYVLTIIGVTIGFHRLLTHRSFIASGGVRTVFTVLGCMAAQGSPLFWVATHRAHHRFTDETGDPHSPHASNAGFRGHANAYWLRRLHGFWHAHVGWMLKPLPSDWLSSVPDLLRDRAVVSTGYAYPFWVLLGIAVPGLAAGLWHQSLNEAAMGALWGGPMRIFLVHHATWSVNSFGHLMGKRAFATRDRSRNNFIIAMLTVGEGWHNNHHAFPSSARHGLTRGQLDLSYVVIRALSTLHLATQINTPSQQQISEALHSE